MTDPTARAQAWQEAIQQMRTRCHERVNACMAYDGTVSEKGKTIQGEMAWVLRELDKALESPLMNDEARLEGRQGKPDAAVTELPLRETPPMSAAIQALEQARKWFDAQPPAKGVDWNQLYDILLASSPALSAVPSAPSAFTAEHLRLAIDHADEHVAMKPEDTYMQRWREGVVAEIAALLRAGRTK